MVTGSQHGTGLKTTDDVAGRASSRGGYSVSRRSVACGRAYPGETIVIVDPDLGEPVGDGEVGEIWVSGSNVGRGYWRRPVETADVFGARLRGVDGAFLRTAISVSCRTARSSCRPDQRHDHRPRDEPRAR
jgi:acyl-CoA synthetase (AMP-forming)/AMP-acid ligase II